jgi:hypothetical protein
MLKRYSAVILILLTAHIIWAQVDSSSLPKKGSYLYYPQPAFEDNSFLLEEAFNQPHGVLQHIFNLSIDDLHGRNIISSFTQEIPLTNLTHQLSYTIYYNALNAVSGATSGFGDLYISYRPMLSGEMAWAMVIPRFTIILPTGKSVDGLGSGGWGGQFNLAITKRLSRTIVTHYNGGFTFISNADKFQSDISGNKVLAFEKNIQDQNLGMSIIWYPKPKFNLLLEYVSNFVSSLESNGAVSKSNQRIINPGMRFCIDNGHMQIVPGISIPVNFVDGKFDHTGLFFYLSFEPDYLSFNKAKGQ